MSFSPSDERIRSNFYRPRVFRSSRAAVEGVDYRLRPGLPSDSGMVADGIVMSNYASSFETKTTPWHLFKQVGHARAAQIILRSEIRVAAPMDMADQITALGFAVVEPATRVIHMVYVKAPHRGMGIARTLVKDMLPDATFTTWTRDCLDWIVKKYARMTYNPYLPQSETNNGE